MKVVETSRSGLVCLFLQGIFLHWVSGFQGCLVSGFEVFLVFSLSLALLFWLASCLPYFLGLV